MDSGTRKLCLLVPYRDRAEHLREFIPHMRAFLANQGIPFSIVVIEQTAGRPFNKGKLVNIGFRFTQAAFEYYCAHDVDMLPLAADYSYCDSPTHLAVEVEQFDWKLAYPTFFGGVILFDQRSYELVNGHCNEYWGWGAEDDDFYMRCCKMDLWVTRRTGRYRSLPHPRRVLAVEYEQNARRLKEFRSSFVNGQFVDGLTTLQYELLESRPLADDCWQITVDV